MDKQKYSKALVLASILCICIGLVAYVFYARLVRPYVRTDDAYVGANYISVISQVSGIVTKSNIANNQFVKQGELLFTIDDRPFVVALSSVKAELDLMGDDVRAAVARLNQAEAHLEVRNNQLEEAKRAAERINNLVRLAVLSPQAKVDANIHLDTAIQNVGSARTDLDEARHNLNSLGETNPRLRIAIAKLDEAKLALSYTKIFAPFDGQISNCTLTAGQYINAGATQFALISYAQIWVDANYKETQLGAIRTGLPVTVEIDMYPGKKFVGEVVSISGATGTIFSLLPPQNATGNWVKVTQRIPVRIMLQNIPEGYPLRIGTSAHVSIKVH